MFNNLINLFTKPLDEITKADILAILDGIDKRAPIVANRALQLIKQFFKWLTQENYLLYNPTSELVIPNTLPASAKISENVRRGL